MNQKIQIVPLSENNSGTENVMQSKYYDTY